MRLIGLAVVLTVSLTLAPLVAGAQQAGKVFQIGILSNVPTSSPTNAPVWEAFIQGLRDLGYVDGQNITIVHRSSEGQYQRLPDLAAELVRLKVDVIVTGATPAVVAAKKATGTIPIVMMGVSDPVGQGLIASLARPGGNVTGLSVTVGSDTVGKGLQLLTEVVPKVRRVAFLSNPANAYSASVISNVTAAAQSLGVELQLLEARGPNEFDDAFATMARKHVGALFVTQDTVLFSHRARLVDLASKSRVPAAYFNREYVEAGGLISYGASVPDQFRRGLAT